MKLSNALFFLILNAVVLFTAPATTPVAVVAPTTMEHCGEGCVEFLEPYENPLNEMPGTATFSSPVNGVCPGETVTITWSVVGASRDSGISWGNVSHGSFWIYVSHTGGGELEYDGDNEPISINHETGSSGGTVTLQLPTGGVSTQCGGDDGLISMVVYTEEFRYRYEVPVRCCTGGSPGPVVYPPIEPPVTCPTSCDYDSPQIGGASAFCPFSELAGNGSHFDFSVATSPGSSGCTGCGGGSSRATNVPNSLRFDRRLIPANQVTIGNCSPGMFFLDLDIRLDLYTDTTVSGKHAAVLFDPRVEKSVLLEDPGDSGTYISDAPNYFKDMTVLDSAGQPATTPSNAVTANVETRDGWEYELEIVSTPVGAGRYGGRIKTITSPEGFVKTFTYKVFTPAEIASNPELQYQIDTITDPSGNTGVVSYHSLQMASRWAISEIDVNNGMAFLEYKYNTDGHLETVKLNDEVISTYMYGEDTQWEAAYITWDQKHSNSPQSKDTIYISSDYLMWEGEVVNQFADNLLGRADGSGYRYMVVARDENTPGLFRVEHRGNLVEWQQGSSWRYFDSWSKSGQGFNSYSGTMESTYALHPGITNAQMMSAQPPTLIDETGYSLDVTYDAHGNVYRKHYDGVSGTDYEQWLYDSKNRVKYYRDREGYVTLTERDVVRGQVVRISRGHEDPDGDGTTSETDANQQIFGYYEAGHPNEGLLKWTTISDYVAGPVAEPPGNSRTDYVYNNINQLIEIIKPLPEGQTVRPKIVYSWVDGQVASVTDETGQVTTYTRDAVNRITSTLFPDGNMTQTWYDDSNNQVYTKDRNDIVSLAVRDSAQRPTLTRKAYGRDSDILDGNIATVHDWTLQHVSQNFYLDGRLQSWKTNVQNTMTETDYDYRGRLIETRRFSAKPSEPVVTTSHTYVDNLLFSTSESVNGYSRTTYNGYSADRFTVRKITTREPAVTFTDNLAVMNAPRASGVEPDYVVADAIRDLSGNLVQVVDGRGTITMNTFDALGRQTQTVRGHNTTMALTSTTQYNARGQIELTTDPAGMQVKTEYDDAGNVKTRTQAFGTVHALIASYSYDAKGRQKTVTSPGNAISTSYYDDCCGNKSGTKDSYGDGSIRVADSGGRTVYRAQVKDFDFDNGNYLDPSATETLGETTSRYYDDGRVQYTTRWKSARGQIDPNSPPIAGVNSVPVADGLTTQYVYFRGIYGSSGNTSKTITRLGGGTATVDVKEAIIQTRRSPGAGGPHVYFASTSSTNSRGRATVAISPDEKTMQVSILDGLGRAIFSGTMTGPAATTPNQLINWTCTQYDMLYNLASFGDTGRVRSFDADANATSVLTDGFGQTVGSLDADDNLTRSKFDEGGALVERTDANSNSVTYTYDDLGRQLTTTTPAGTTSTAYNATTGRVDWRTDAKSNSTSYVYDILSRQETTTDRLGQDTVRTYDSAGRLHTLTDAESKTTTYTYDLLGRKLTTTYPDASVVTNDYDPSGSFPTGSRAVKMTYDSGKSKTSISSFDGTLDKIEYRDTLGTLAGTDDYSYDSELRHSGSTSADGIVRALTYDDEGLLATDTTTYGGQSYTVTYGYDSLQRQNSITYPSGRVASLTRTDRGNLDTISWASAQIEDRAYDAAGRLTSIDRAFTDETRTYDTANRLLSIDNTSVGTATYTWDANSNKLSETWTGNMASHSFTTEKAGAGSYEDGYDEEDRFRRFIQSSQSNDIYLARTDIGNISDVQVNSTSYLRSYSDAHELTSVDGTSQTFDDDGNQTTTHTGATLSWNDANRLSGTTQGTVTSTYKYDSDNKRVSKKVVDGATTTEDTVYIYAGPNCIAEYQLGTTAVSPDQEYVYADGIDSLVLLSRNNNADQSIVTRNQQWSITALANTANGNVQERYVYDHFGNRTILDPDGVTVRTSSSYNLPYGYTSRRHDDESSLVYFRARNYDPATGEFISRDSLEYVDGMSLMRGYMGLNGADPSGNDGILFDDLQSAKHFKKDLEDLGAKNVRIILDKSKATETFSDYHCDSGHTTLITHFGAAWVFTDYRDSDAVFAYADRHLPPETDNERRNSFLLASGVLPNKEASTYFVGQTLVEADGQITSLFDGSIPMEIDGQVELDPNFKIDIGGEGRYADTVNINIRYRTSTPGPTDTYGSNERIKGRLFMITPGISELPFRSNSVQSAISQNSAFFAEPYPTEIPRVLAPGATYEVWHGVERLRMGIKRFQTANSSFSYTEPKLADPDWFEVKGIMFHSTLSFGK